ncbi:MAG: peptidoglycan DD-metalloendopeptidase family protein [Clostridiales bacterium]|nr:peptidoglycan DD-metalloendopeptidase family protein [Clostridiales bacterium]
MKTKRKLLSVMLATCLIFPAFASYPEAYSEKHPCLHNTLYEFDNETMTVKGVYEGNRLDAFFADVRFYSDEKDTAVILENGVPVTEGVFREGMTIQIYHENALYGEYRIAELLETADRDRPMRAPAANAYGFTLPLDNMNLTSHVSAGFGSDYGGPNTGYSDHRGTDFSWGGITGTPIRAIKSGTVDATNIHSTYGNHVRIDHGSGQKSLYAHMNATPLVSQDQWVEQGQVIGYVGSSGNVTGPHLHLEIQINGALVNPVTALAGASTYSPPSPAKSFTVKYHPNGGSGSMADTIVTYGVSTPTRKSTFTNPNHIFEGWYVKNNTTGKWRYYNPKNTDQSEWYVEGSQPSGWQKMIYENGESVGWTALPGETVTFYAVWRYGFKIQYNANGGSGSMPDTYVTTGVDTQTRPSTFLNPNYVCIGWNLKWLSTGKWKYYNPKNEDESDWYLEGQQPSGWVKDVYTNGGTVAWTVPPGETVIFYAVWTYGFKIQYNANGGSGSMPDTYVRTGVDTQTRPNTFVNPNHVFVGWNLKWLSTGKWKYYNPKNEDESDWYLEGQQPSGWVKDVYTNGGTVAWTVPPGETVIFYAVWTYGFRVQYNANGGSGTMQDTIIPYGVYTPTRINTFTRPGYTFKGWHVKYVTDNTWRYYNPKNEDETGWYIEGKQPAGWVKMVYLNGESIAWTTNPGETIIFYAVWE